MTLFFVTVDFALTVFLALNVHKTLMGGVLMWPVLLHKYQDLLWKIFAENTLAKIFATDKEAEVAQLTLSDLWTLRRTIF